MSFPIELVEQGACRDYDPELFFSLGSPGAAVSVCRSCLVLDRCRAWAVQQPSDLVGVWGATTAYERRKLRGERVEAAR